MRRVVKEFPANTFTDKIKSKARSSSPKPKSRPTLDSEPEISVKSRAHSRRSPLTKLHMIGRKPAHWTRRPLATVTDTANMYNLHMLLLKPDGQGFARKYYPSGVSAQANKRSQAVSVKER